MPLDIARFETLALHGGSYRADPTTGAVAVPIYQSTSFQFQDTEHADRLFALDELGFIYSRVANPTQDALEQRIAALEGGAPAGRRFINALRLFYHVADIGDARSLAIHPATTTHSQLSPENQLATGVSPGYVRLSVGIEHPDDIIADLVQALDAARGAGEAQRAAA